MSTYGQGYAQTRHLDPQAQAAADEFDRQLAERERIQQMRNAPPLLDPWAGQAPPQPAPPPDLVNPFPAPPDPMGGSGRVDGGGSYSMEIGDPEPLTGQGRVQGGGAYQMEIGEPDPLPPQTQAPAPVAPSPPPSPTPSQPGAGMPGATVTPTSSATQAAVAGQQAAQQMAPQAPPMPTMGEAGPQFALGGAGLGQRAPQVDVGGLTDPRYQRASARADDDRQRRRQRILRTLGTILAARSIQSGGMGGVGIPLMLASGGVRPPSAEARLNADEQRQQSAAQRLFEQRMAMAEEAREGASAQATEGERERHNRAMEEIQRLGAEIRGMAEGREQDFVRAGTTRAQQARQAFEGILALATPEMRAAWSDERMRGMSAYDFAEATDAIQSELQGRFRGGRGGRSGGGGGAVPQEGDRNTAPATFIAEYVAGQGGNPTDPASWSDAQRSLANDRWRTMDEGQQQRWMDQRNAQWAQQLGSGIRGFTPTGVIPEARRNRAEQLASAARGANRDLSIMISIAQQVSALERAGALADVGSEALHAYNAARRSMITRLRVLRNLGTPQAEELRQLAAELPELSDPRMIVNGAGRLRALRDQMRRDALSEMADLGYAPTGGGNPFAGSYSWSPSGGARSEQPEQSQPAARTQPRRRAPQAGDVRFRDNGRIYSVPREEVRAFLRDRPNAQRIGGGQ